MTLLRRRPREVYRLLADELEETMPELGGGWEEAFAVPDRTDREPPPMPAVRRRRRVPAVAAASGVAAALVAAVTVAVGRSGESVPRLVRTGAATFPRAAAAPVVAGTARTMAARRSRRPAPRTPAASDERAVPWTPAGRRRAAGPSRARSEPVLPVAMGPEVHRGEFAFEGAGP